MRIKNWRTFQHYRHRSPPWIRLHRVLLDDLEWHNLDGEAAKALVMLWLIASEDEGKLPSIKKIAFRLRISEKQATSIVSSLNHWLEQDASKPLAEGLHDAVPEAEAEAEADISEADISEADISEVCASAPEKLKATRLHDDWSPDLEGYRFAVDALGSREAAQREFEKFRDYWRSKPGAGATKLDWSATWRNWIRNAQTRGRSHGKSGQSLENIATELADEARELERAAGLKRSPTAV